MGAPTGHPFFGNQYTNGGYIPGTFTYEGIEKGKEIIKPLLKEASKAVPHVAPKQKQDNLILKKLFASDYIDITLVITSIIAVSPSVRSIIDELRRKKTKEKEDSLPSIELQNIGTCTHCGEPLISSTYVPESEEDAYNAYILCKKCGEKNFARYFDNNL